MWDRSGGEKGGRPRAGKVLAARRYAKYVGLEEGALTMPYTVEILVQCDRCPQTLRLATDDNDPPWAEVCALGWFIWLDRVLCPECAEKWRGGLDELFRKKP